MAALSVTVDWYGPYDSIQSAQEAAREEFDNGLYIGIGKSKWDREVAIQYIGIAESLASRVGERHKKLSLIVRDLEIWLGEVSSFGKPGRRRNASIPAHLDLAEWAFIYFLDLPLNDRKKVRHPYAPVTVHSRWYDIQYNLREAPPHPDFPIMIDFIGKEDGAKIQFTDRQEMWSSDEI